MQFQQILREKREQFHIQIRRQEIEHIFEERRNQMRAQNINNIIQSQEEIIKTIKYALLKQNTQELENQLQNLQTKLLIEKQLYIPIYELIFIFNLIENLQNFNDKIISQILLLLYTTVMVCKLEDINILLQSTKLLCQINQLIYQCTEFEVDVIDLIFIILQNIGRKSEIYLNLIIENNFLDAVKWIIEKIDLQKDEKCLLTIFDFLSIFVSFQSNKQSKELDLILIIINRMCKKLFLINYFSFDDHFNQQITPPDSELKVAVINKLLTLLKFSIDKKGNLFDISNYKNIKNVVWFINFSERQLSQFQKVTAYIINIQSQAIQNVVKQLIENNEFLILNLFQLTNFCQRKGADYEKIRMHSTNTIRNLLPYVNHQTKLSYQELLVNQINTESSFKVLPYLFESFHLLLQERPSMDQLQLLEEKLKISYEVQSWPNLKQILNCIFELAQIDEMKSIKESETGKYIELLSNSGSKQIQEQASQLLEKIQ